MKITKLFYYRYAELLALMSRLLCMLLFSFKNPKEGRSDITATRPLIQIMQ